MGPACIVRTAAVPRAVEQVDDALARFWTRHERVPEAIRLQTGIAVAEIVANIVEHGSGPTGVAWIEIGVAIHADHVVVVIADDGTAADVDVHAADMPEDMLAERGRGLAMVKRLCDGLTHERRDGRNLWTMTSKHFRPNRR